jgi:hypothetical protein
VDITSMDGLSTDSHPWLHVQVRNAAMTKDTPTPDALVTRLLLLPDGTVLAENLTPSMAAALKQMCVHAEPETQASLRTTRVRKTVVSQAHTGETSRTP